MAKAKVEGEVDIPEGIRITGRGLDVQVKGKLRASQQNGLPVLEGSLQAVSGTMDLQGSTLAIEGGTVTFYGTPGMNPHLDLTLGKQVKDVTVHAHITGTLDSPRLDLTSEPPMSQGDILSYMLFGKPLNDLNSVQALGLQNRALSTAEEFAASQLTAPLQRELSLDVLSFQTASQEADTTQSSSSLTIGKYIGSNLLLTYQQDLTSGNNFEIVVQYWLAGGFKLETHTQRYRQSGVVLNWSRDY
jgi:autotransporter translocation and assembly factor TamB